MLHESTPPQDTVGQGIALREGAHIVIPKHENLTTREIVEQALLGSMAMQGKPVRCAGVIPGITLWISTGRLYPRDKDEAVAFSTEIWSKLEPNLVQWLRMKTPPPGVSMQLGDVACEFWWDNRRNARPAAINMEVQRDPAEVRRYLKERRRKPLAVLKRPAQVRTPDDAVTQVQRLASEALIRTRRTAERKLLRLPGLIRYRVTGAMPAWHLVREAVDRTLSSNASSINMTHALRTYGLPPLINYFREFASRLLPYGTDGFSADQVQMIAAYSAVWLAFEVRNGAFYEPTPPLHRLLDASYIADDVPIGMLQLPADTLCIVPDPSRWERGDHVESIAIFKGAHGLSFALWVNDTDDRRMAVMDVMQLPVDDPNKPIRELVDDVLRNSRSGDEQARQRWRNVLDYAIKMLLYLNARDAHVTPDRAYSDAPRNFSGLGQRMRAERMAEIEMLYDRHIVGPAVLDAQAVGALPSDGEHHEVRGHWRRPHFRMQPHGPRSSLRKLAFIGPTIVRPDRLGLA